MSRSLAHSKKNVCTSGTNTLSLLVAANHSYLCHKEGLLYIYLACDFFVCSFSALRGNSISLAPCEETYGFFTTSHPSSSFFILSIAGIHLTPIPEEIFLGSHQVSVPIWADHFPGLLHS